ncbi:MAG: 3-coathanger stack domain-containing protein [Bacteroidota bacterium]
MKRNKFLTTSLLAVLLMSMISLQGQNGVSDLYLNAATDDFATVQHTMTQYFTGRDKGKGSGYKQWQRWEYETSRHLAPGGKITNSTLRNWNEYHAYLQAHPDQQGDAPDATHGQWIGKGPSSWVLGAGHGPGMGRTNCIAFHPTDPLTFWVGTPAGGLWRTNDGGATWTPLTDGMPTIGVSGIAVDYIDPNIIYILTGDGDGLNTYSIGVLKTTDGGETWNSTGFSAPITGFLRAWKLVIHPTDHNILFTVSNHGIDRTTDGGINWIQVQAGIFQDIEFKPGDPTIMYATGGTEFFRSVNSGAGWTRLYSGVPTNASRMAIGVTPNNPSEVYLLAGPHTGMGTFVGFYCSTDNGGSFSLRTNTPNLLSGDLNGADDSDQTFYDLAIAVSRTNSNKIMIGGVNTWVSSNGGWNASGWTLTSMWNIRVTGHGYTHADIHNLDINPLNNFLYCMSDGGVFRSTDMGSSWTDLSTGLVITQYYRIAGYEGNPNLIIGGVQDNGVNKWSGGTEMLHILGSDGADCIIDNLNSSVMYYCSNGGDIFRSINEGVNCYRISPAGGQNQNLGPFITPFVLHPANNNKIYGGYFAGVCYRQITGTDTAWHSLGSDGTSALAFGKNNTQRIYAAGVTNQHLKTSQNGGSTWTSIWNGLPNMAVNGMAVDPDDASSVFITFGGYTQGVKVYHSTNAGVSWTNISGTLPNVPVQCIAFQDNNGSPANAIYIGTDIGVFYRDDNHSDWIRYSNGMPAVPVIDLEINYTSNIITAGTFGRGLWQSSLYSACPGGYTLRPDNDPSNPNYTGYQLYEASNDITSSRIITGGVGTDVTYKSGNYVKLTTGFNAREHNVFRATLGPCSGQVVSAPLAKKVTGKFMGNIQH